MASEAKVGIVAVALVAIVAALVVTVSLSTSNIHSSKALATSSHFGDTPSTGTFLVDAQMGREEVMSAANGLLTTIPSSSSSSLSTLQQEAKSLITTVEGVAAQLRNVKTFGVQNEEKAQIEKAYANIIKVAKTIATTLTSSSLSTDLAELAAVLSQMTAVQEVP